MTIHAVPDSAAPGTTYSAAQAAQLLGVSERRVRQLVEEGRSPRKRAHKFQEGPIGRARAAFARGDSVYLLSLGATP